MVKQKVTNFITQLLRVSFGLSGIQTLNGFID